MRHVTEQEIASRQREIQEVFEVLGIGSDTEREKMRFEWIVDEFDFQNSLHPKFALDLTNTSDPIHSIRRNR